MSNLVEPVSDTHGTCLGAKDKRLSFLINHLPVIIWFKEFQYKWKIVPFYPTPQVPAKHDLVMCFGPVVPDGYGICYNPQENHFNFAVSAFNTSPETDSDLYAKKLQESLLEMRDVLESVPPQAKL